MRRRVKGSVLEDRHGAGEARRSAADLEGEAGHHEARGRQALEIGELLDMAVGALHAGAVPLPDDRRVAGLRKAFGRVYEGSVPAPGIGSGNADAAFSEVERCL